VADHWTSEVEEVVARAMCNPATGCVYTPDDTNTCRACHLPLTGKDFVHRYDEHFATRP